MALEVNFIEYHKFMVRKLHIAADCLFLPLNFNAAYIF